MTQMNDDLMQQSYETQLFNRYITEPVSQFLNPTEREQVADVKFLSKLLSAMQS